MANNIKIGNLAETIASELTNYSTEVAQEMEEIRERVAKKTVRRLKKTSPEQDIPTGGKYAKSWKLTREKSFAGATRFIVHTKAPGYWLTHLLEHGHAKVNGGRVQGQPHIKPAEDAAIKEYLEETEKVIKG